MHALSTMLADGRHDGLNDFDFVLNRLLEALDALPRLDCWPSRLMLRAC